MRRILITALLAVPLLIHFGARPVTANPPGYEEFGPFGHAFRTFSHIHQHGPLYNYGPYYGYYPFKPYGPWDAYLRYDPFFYGDPYANWGARREAEAKEKEKLHTKHNWAIGGFWHASWLHGGWFRGHVWLTGGHKHKASCSSCGGVALAQPVAPTGDATARFSGFGSPNQSAVFFSATPTLDPALDLLPTAGQSR
jgi:hypothetical protein